MELDIRGEMEAAAAELDGATASDDSSPEEGTPASEPETQEEGETADDAASEQPEAPATEESDDSDGTPAPSAKPAEKAEDGDDLPVGGSIPVPRVRKILDNARAKAREEVEAKYKPFEPVFQYSPEDVTEAIRIVKYASENPVEYFHQLRTRLQNAGLIEREAPAAKRDEAPAQKGDGRPQPDVLLEDGRVVYSAERMQALLDWQAKQVEERVNERIKPITERDEQERRDREFMDRASKAVKEAASWPGFEEHRKEIAETMLAKNVSLDVAYSMVVRNKTTLNEKQIREDERKRVLAELKKKPSASTATGKASPATPDFKGKSVREVLEATAAELGVDDDE